jgi:hypothetical protein
VTTIAGWEILTYPTTDDDPSVLRRELAMRIERNMLSDWAEGLRIGFAETAGDTATVDVTTGPSGSVEALHSLVDDHGRGYVAATRVVPVDGGSEATCRITPIRRYARDHAPAQVAVGDGMEVRVEAHLNVLRGTRPGHGTMLRRADLARTEPPGTSDPMWTRGSAVPGLLFSGCGLGPRPHKEPQVVLVDRSSLYAMDHVDEPVLMGRSVTGWCSVEWIRGVVPEALAIDATWQSTPSATAGRLEVLDTGDAGLWRTVTPVPEPLRADWESEEEPVALVRTDATEVFRALTQLAT